MLILSLPCGCTLVENHREIQVFNSKRCTLDSHFSKQSGWPQLIDPKRIEVLHDDRK